MTKLNVVIPAVNVMVEIDGSNVEFRKVDRKAQAGDIVKALVSSLDVEAGAFYAIAIDEYDEAYFLDDAGDVNGRADTDGYPEEFEVYAPVSAVNPAESSADITFESAQYRKVDRSAREGDVIILRSAPFEEYDITQGIPYEVTRVDSSDDPHIKDDGGSDYDTCDDVFDVYEKVSVETPASDVKYREVKRKPAEPVRLKIGDYAKVLAFDMSYASAAIVGLIVELTETDHSNRPYRGKKLDGTRAGWFTPDQLTPATAEEVSAARAEAQRKQAIGPFADGGFAQIIDRTKSLAMSAADTDGYVKVSVEPDGKYALSLKKPNGEYSGYCNADALRQITEEEYNAAVAPKPKFSVGDNVRLTIADGERPSYGWGSVSNGDIGRITQVFGASLRVDFPKQRSWDAKPSELTKLTAEEAQEISKWAQINREVGELKTGDVVMVERTCSAPLKVGELISIIRDSHIDSAKVTGGWAVVATLVTPVEQRFDTEQAVA